MRVLIEDLYVDGTGGLDEDMQIRASSRGYLTHEDGSQRAGAGIEYPS